MTTIKETALTFGQAIEAAKQGKMIARAGWNGKNMFVFQRPEDNLDVYMVVEKVKSLPQSVKDYFRRVNPGTFIPNEEGATVADATIKFLPYLCMKAADGSVVNGWLASQTDMLATDWDIVE